MEHHLQQHIPEFLAERLLITGFERVQRLVRFLKQVRRERRMGLPRVPGALHAQPVHGRHQVDQPRPRQISGALQELSLRDRRRRPHQAGPTTQRLERLEAKSSNLITNPRLVQREQLRMTGEASTA